MYPYTLHPDQIAKQATRSLICNALNTPQNDYPGYLIHRALIEGRQDTKRPGVTAHAELHIEEEVIPLNFTLTLITYEPYTKTVGAVYFINDQIQTCTWTIPEFYSKQLQKQISKQNPQKPWATQH